jgi:hypothetical protein
MPILSRNYPMTNSAVKPSNAIESGQKRLYPVVRKYSCSSTHLPVRVESTTDKVGGLLHVVGKDFSFDQRDPSLLAVVPPEGYQVVDMSQLSELQAPQPHVPRMQP